MSCNCGILYYLHIRNRDSIFVILYKTVKREKGGTEKKTILAG
jgi:hypothetical protein